MTTTIKNLNLIQGLLTPDQLEKLEHGAKLHLRHSRIHFKVLDKDSDSITVQVMQTKSPAENYLDKKGLADRTKELFGKFFPHLKIHARPIAYVPPAVDDVSPYWLQRKLEEKGLQQARIVEMTGIDKTNISAWIRGTRPMTQPVKAMFYFMLNNCTMEADTKCVLSGVRIYDL